MYQRPFGPFTAAGLLAAILVAAWAYSPENTPASSSIPSLQCEARFDPRSIDAGTVLEEVIVVLSEPVDEINEVDTPANSGLTIIWLHHGGGEPESARVRVSALRANPGEWNVTLRGPNHRCTGTFAVVEAP